MIEIRLGGVDADDRDAALAEHGVSLSEQLLEVDVADVPRVVVARDDDDGLAVDRVHVFPRRLIFLAEPEGREIAAADDDVGLELVDLVDRSLQQVRHEVGLAAMEVGDVRDRVAVLHGQIGGSMSIFALHAS